METPVKTTDEPVKKVETPVKPTDESVKKVETPVKTTDEPVKKAETPVKTTDEPVKKAETPVKTTDGPVKKVETPVKTTDKPVKKVETPVKTTDELVKKVETPVKTMDELVKKVETPVKTTDESVKKVDNMTKQADSVVKTTDNIIPSPVPANNITMVFKESPVVDTLKEDTLKEDTLKEDTLKKATLKTDSILQKPLENKTAKPVTENQANTDGKTSGDNSVSKENQVMVQTDIPKNRIDLKVSPSEQVNVGTSNLLKSQTIPAPLPLVEQTKPIDQQKKTVVTTKPDIKGTKKIEPLPLKNNTGDTKEEPLAIKKESKGNENMASLKPNLEDPAKMQQMTTNTVLLKPSVPSLARQNNPSQPEQDLSNPKKITVLRPSISSIQRQKDTKDTPSTPAGDSLQMKNKNSISLPKALRTHTVKSNDTDESLRKQYKWNESQFSVFLSLNKGKKDVKGQYAVGTILSIP